jgi:uncharacterized protein (DUF1697 family)
MAREASAAFAALLRAVNLGGSTQLSMERVRGIFEDLGFGEVRSLLNSGNLVFRGAREDPRSLETRLESEIERATGKRVEVFVRSSAEWGPLLAGNPFRAEAERDPGHHTVAFLKAAPPSAAWKALDAAIVGRERVAAAGRLAYVVYPDGQGRSKLTAAVIERALGTRVTVRNWNTVRKIGAALGVPYAAVGPSGGGDGTG